MKTILDWLIEARFQGYSWANAALKNYNPPIKEDEETDIPSLAIALGKAFDWIGSPEGEVWWDIVVSDLEQGNVATSLHELSLLYEDISERLGVLMPDSRIREPYRQAILEAYKSNYEAELAELSEKIAEKLGMGGLSAKLKAVNAELERTKEEYERSDKTVRNLNKDRERQLSYSQSLEKELEFLKNRRVVEGWIVQNEDKSYSIIASPTIYKDDGRWIYNQAHNPPDWVDVPENDLKEFNCKIPKWEDEEPTPIYK